MAVNEMDEIRALWQEQTAKEEVLASSHDLYRYAC